MTEIENYTWIAMQASHLKDYFNWQEGTFEECIGQTRRALPIVFSWLEHREYIAGDTFSLADIYYYQLLSWNKMFEIDMPAHVETYLAKLEQRESFPLSFKAEMKT